MWLKILFLLVIAAKIRADSIDLPEDVSTYLEDMGYNVDLKNNFSHIANHINGVLKSLNLSEVEVNINLNHLEDTSHRQEFEKSLKFLFQSILGSNWQMKYILQEVAVAANNLTVNEILYEILWQEMKKDNNKTNPFLYLELYEDVGRVIKNFSSPRLLKLNNEIEMDLVISSVQLLKSYFIHNSTIWRLLGELKRVDNLYQATIPKVFENLNTLENNWLLAKDLLEFDFQTQEAVFNHISFINYLKSRHDVIPQKIYKNLELLVSRPDFLNISLEQRQEWSQLLPKSLRNLFSTQKLCLRNVTTNSYLFECPQTYLMCTNFIAQNVNPINRKKAAYVIERLGNNQYTFSSPYWKRYFHLQSYNNTKTLNSTQVGSHGNVAQITKNLYSHADASPWLIRFQGDYALIQDPAEEFYVCGGDPTYWNNMERYAYTRLSRDFNLRQNECLWLLEDCSDVV